MNLKLFKRIGVTFTSLVFVTGMVQNLPARDTVHAVVSVTGSDSTGDDLSVFDLLGFDTSAPAEYNENAGVADSPYGKSFTTVGNVVEPFVLQPCKDGTAMGYLMGNDVKYGTPYSDFVTDPNGTDKTNLIANKIESSCASLMVEGNFSKDNKGKKSNVLYFTAYPYDISDEPLSKISISVLDPITGKSATIVNGIDYERPDDDGMLRGKRATASKYFKDFDIATGDFDGDGIDEIVWIESKNVRVYKLMKTEGKSYLNADNWRPFNAYYDATQITVGDFNKDGIDDLAGVVMESDDNYDFSYEKAYILFGAENARMFNECYDFNLLVNGDKLRWMNISSGDIDNDGFNEVVIGGVLESSNVESRYLSIFKWNGSSFNQLAAENFDIFEEKDGSRRWVNTIGRNDGSYRSACASPVNICVGKFYGAGTAPCVYMDGLVIEYGDNGLNILDMIDDELTPIKGAVTDYVEWGARAVDIDGSGTDVLVTVCGSVSNFNDNGKVKNYTYDTFYDDVITGSDINHGNYYALNIRKLNSDKAASTSLYNNSGVQLTGTSRCSLAACFPDTDTDTVLMEYTGEHYYSYSDPKVLAVLASPPFFRDLDNENSANMMVASTVYTSIDGDATGSNKSAGFSMGVYTSCEYEFKVFGIPVAKAEMEREFNNSFTWETEELSSREFEISYGTMAGQDTVALYTVPVEKYVYKAYIPKEDGKGYDSQYMEVNIPHEPSVKTISLSEYQLIQKDYEDVLPNIEGEVLKHTVGEPASYPSSIEEIPVGNMNANHPIVSNGDPATLGKDGTSFQSRVITMGKETTDSFNYEFDFSYKVGGGAYGMTVGCSLGTTVGTGTVKVSTSGSSYQGEIYSVSKEAAQYGYSFNWKLAAVNYNYEFPVITYIVTDVIEPPCLPENFIADEKRTDTDSITLTWETKGNPAGYIISKYFQSPSASGYYEIATINGANYEYMENGVKHYAFEDVGLSANTGYKYRIQTIGKATPNLSIPSDPIQTYTKPSGNVPEVTVDTTDLYAYPDIVVSAKASMREPVGSIVTYSWQKKNDNNEWNDIDAVKGRTLCVSYATKEDAGVYRCKASVLSNQNLMTLYSPEVTVHYSRRNAVFEDVSAVLQEDGTVRLRAKVKANDVDTICSGNMCFTLTSKNDEFIYNTQLDATGMADFTITPQKEVYKVDISYGGNRVFKPADYEYETPLFVKVGDTADIFYDFKSEYTYGDPIHIMKYTINEDTTVSGVPYTMTNKNTYIKTENGWELQNNIVTKDNYAYTPGTYCFTDTDYGYAEPSDDSPLIFTIKKRSSDIKGLKDSYFFIPDARHKDFDAFLEKVLRDLELTNPAEVWKDTETKLYSASKIKLLEYEYDTNRDCYDINYYADTDKLEMIFYNQWKRTEKNSFSSYLYLFYLDSKYELPPIVLNFKTSRFSLYNVNVDVADGKEALGWGSVKVVYPETTTISATVGQSLMFRAYPVDGYEVDYWSVNGTKIDGSEGKETFTWNQTSEGSDVKVHYKVKQNTFTVYTLPSKPTVNGIDVENKVEADSVYFVNGKIISAGSDVTFTPVAADGWHFTNWEYHAGTSSPKYSSTVPYTVTMGNDSVVLYAKFERDVYQLTLSDNLVAYTGGLPITTISAVKGDTIVTIKPEAGFAAENYLVNGEVVTIDESGYTFTMQEDTTVSADISPAPCNIKLNQSQNGTAEASSIGTINGGTVVSFSATPERGYSFKGWKSADSDTLITKNPYTITVTDDMTLTPVFEKRTDGKTMKLTNSVSELTWKMDGVAVSDARELVVYPDESVTLTVSPKRGKIIAGWTMDGAFKASTNKTTTLTYKEIPAKLTAVFKGFTSYTVTFEENIVARADDVEIKSGDLVGSGSNITFMFIPENSDDHVKQWLVNGEAVADGKITMTIDNLNRSLNVNTTHGAVENNMHEYNSSGICSCHKFDEPKLNDAGTPADTADDYYEIANAGQLASFASYVNSGNNKINAVLTADIDMTEVFKIIGDWTMIGTYQCPYYGMFDGKGYTVSNLYFNDVSHDYAGLFGIARNVKNVIVADSTFIGYRYVGAICGLNEDVISGCQSINCYIEGSTTGGICGYSKNKVVNCINNSDVIGKENSGGIVGKTYYDTRIENCINYGYVNGNSICGYLYKQDGGVGSCFYLAEEYEETNNGTAVTAEQFASGEIAYLLNGETSEGELAWGQNLDNGESADAVPVLGGPTVYKKNIYSGCTADTTHTASTYGNTPSDIFGPHDCDENGVCSVCGKKTLTVSDDIAIKMPSSVYDGTAKKITVEAAEGIEAGAITVKYFAEDGTQLMDAPTETGVYHVYADIAESEDYIGIADLFVAELRISAPIIANLTVNFTSFGDEEETNIQLFKSDALIDEKTVVGSQNYMAYTGQVSFEKLSDGDYIVAISKNGHTTREYSITVSSSQTITLDAEIYLSGDVTGDGVIDSADDMQYSRYINGLTSVFDVDDETMQYLIDVADLTGEGNVDSSDAMQISRFINGLESLLKA